MIPDLRVDIIYILNSFYLKYKIVFCFRTKVDKRTRLVAIKHTSDFWASQNHSLGTQTCISQLSSQTLESICSFMHGNKTPSAHSDTLLF